MESNKRKRGGGRKFSDGKLSKRQFIQLLRKEFEYQSSIKHFLYEAEISRQSYYRFLNKYPNVKEEIQTHRHNFIVKRKQDMKRKLKFLRENPEKHMVDYYLRNIKISEISLSDTRL
jgi:DNA-binding transcriptional MerR regulator